MLPLITLNDAHHLFRKDHRSGRRSEDKLFVLIDNVEIMDDPQGVVKRIGGVIWLKPFDKGKDISVCDSCYFSFIKFAPVMIDRPFVENRELDLPRVLYMLDREVPNDVVKTGSQVVNNFARQYTESRWNNTILMILNCLKEQLTIVLWEDGVAAFLKEVVDFPIEIGDVLFGSF